MAISQISQLADTLRIVVTRNTIHNIQTDKVEIWWEAWVTDKSDAVLYRTKPCSDITYVMADACAHQIAEAIKLNGAAFAEVQ